MIEFIVRQSPAILLGLDVLLFVLLFAARSVKVLRNIQWSLCVTCLLSLLIFSYFAWIFRDGFMTRPSEGMTALLLFAKRIWRFFLIIAGFLIMSLCVYRLRLRRLRG